MQPIVFSISTEIQNWTAQRNFTIMTSSSVAEKKLKEKFRIKPIDFSSFKIFLNSLNSVDITKMCVEEIRWGKIHISVKRQDRWWNINFTRSNHKKVLAISSTHPTNHLVCTGNFSSNLTDLSTLKRETVNKAILCRVTNS